MESTILCIASYEKGYDLLRECAARGVPPILVTVEKLKDAPWPRDALAELLWMPDLGDRESVIDGVSWLARNRRIGRIVALDEFDLELASTLREHLRLPGLGETAVRYFRDKLAMRQRALAAGVAVPRFGAVFNDDDVRTFIDAVPPPWVLKPRTEAAAIGIRRVESADALLAELEALGDRRSRFLVEEYVPGEVLHVDGLVSDGRVVFARAARYATPPFDVAHGGGLFASTSGPPGSAGERELLDANVAILDALGAPAGAMHTELIRAESDGRLVFLETAARVGGALIADMVEAASVVNLWREWGAIEVARLRGEPYVLPEARPDSAGLLISLARQERPDLAGYDDAEIVWRLDKKHHAGLIAASPDPVRIEALIASWMPRFRDDFMATLPAPDRPTA
jgi:hypothetical protein